MIAISLFLRDAKLSITFVTSMGTSGVCALTPVQTANPGASVLTRRNTLNDLSAVAVAISIVRRTVNTFHMHGYNSLAVMFKVSHKVEGFWFTMLQRKIHRLTSVLKKSKSPGMSVL